MPTAIATLPEAYEDWEVYASGPHGSGQYGAGLVPGMLARQIERCPRTSGEHSQISEVGRPGRILLAGTVCADDQAVAADGGREIL